MALNFKKYVVEGLGKIIKDTKKIHIWNFDKSKVAYTLIVTDSILTSKLRIKIQKSIVFEGSLSTKKKKRGVDFEFDGMCLKVQKVNDNKFDLFINKIRFASDRLIEDDIGHINLCNLPIHDESIGFNSFLNVFKKSQFSNGEIKTEESFGCYSLVPTVMSRLEPRARQFEAMSLKEMVSSKYLDDEIHINKSNLPAYEKKERRGNTPSEIQSSSKNTHSATKRMSGLLVKKIENCDDITDTESEKKETPIKSMNPPDRCSKVGSLDQKALHTSSNSENKNTSNDKNPCLCLEITRKCSYQHDKDRKLPSNTRTDTYLSPQRHCFIASYEITCTGNNYDHHLELGHSQRNLADLLSQRQGRVNTSCDKTRPTTTVAISFDDDLGDKRNFSLDSTLAHIKE